MVSLACPHLTVLTVTTVSPVRSVLAQPPGRIFKGQRMAGRMGGVRRTVQNLRVQAVDVEKGLLLISGAIPGPKNGIVLVRSAVKGA